MENIKEAPAFFALRDIETSAPSDSHPIDVHNTDGRAVLGDAYAAVDTAHSGLARRGDMPPRPAMPSSAHGLQRRPSLSQGPARAQAGVRQSLADFTRRHMLAAWVAISASVVPGGAIMPREVPAEMVNFAHELADRHADPERDDSALDHRRGPLTPNVLRLAAWLACSDTHNVHYADVKHSVLHAVFSWVAQPGRRHSAA